jgi:hypothetical protein
VEASAKGDPSKTIPVKIRFPAGPRGRLGWQLPLQTKLLLLLKKDPSQEGTFELMAQQTSWLAIVRPHATGASTSDPNQFVLDDAKEFLTECADRPGTSAAISYYADIAEFSELGVVVSSFPQSDPAREHALDTIKNLASGDPELVALAAKFEGEYGKVGEIASLIGANSGDTNYLLAQLKEYNAQPVTTDVSSGRFIQDSRENFRWQVAGTVQHADDIGKMMPVVLLALASPDVQMRRTVVGALTQRQSQGNEGFEDGNRLGNQYYPVLVKLLDDPDREVQYGAMACIFWMSGCVTQQAWDRDLHLWATDIVRQNPDFYVAQYKAWWEKNKGNLSP